ncbi:MAG: hypothetical protein OER88_04050 [Planctomycetota bacterium]|nr:hypothetical protein [Planctomycetota bacterium]
MKSFRAVRVRAPWTVTQPRPGEQELWEQTLRWSDPGIARLVWIISPDRRVREGIRYKRNGRNLTADELHARIVEICRRHGVALSS